MRDSGFIFKCANLLRGKYIKLNLKRGNDIQVLLIRYKRATINPIIDDDSCFQYNAIVGSDCEEIGKSSKRKSQIQPFIKKYDWKGIKRPLEKDDWKKLRKIIQQLL